MTHKAKAEISSFLIVGPLIRIAATVALNRAPLKRYQYRCLDRCVTSSALS